MSEYPVTQYTVKHYRNPTCENKDCKLFGQPIPMSFDHGWLEDAPLGSIWRSFCKCGDGTGVRLIGRKLLVAK